MRAPPRASAAALLALELAAGLGEEDVVERRRVQLEVGRSRGSRRRARARPSASSSAPPLEPHRRRARARRDRRAEALEHAGDRVAVVAARPASTSSVGRPISAFSASGVPSATIWPWSMIPTRSASTSASSRYCVVRKTVTPSSRASRATSCPQVGAALRVEAGRRLVEEQDRAGGGRARARGRAGASCRPSSRRPCGRPRRSGRRARAARRRAGGARPSGALQRGLQAHVLAPGEQRVERGLLERGADRRRARAGPSRTMSWPATRAVPAVGGSSVVSISTVVDLPAPLGPRKP